MNIDDFLPQSGEFSDKEDLPFITGTPTRDEIKSMLENINPFESLIGGKDPIMKIKVYIAENYFRPCSTEELMELNYEDINLYIKMYNTYLRGVIGKNDVIVDDFIHYIEACKIKAESMTMADIDWRYERHSPTPISQDDFDRLDDLIMGKNAHIGTVFVPDGFTVKDTVMFSNADMDPKPVHFKWLEAINLTNCVHVDTGENQLEYLKEHYPDDYVALSDFNELITMVTVYEKE